MKEGTKVFVGRCGSGHTVFGEMAVFSHETATQFVFVTKSGSIVKTDKNMNTVGKAKKEGYFVSTNIDWPDAIKERVHYWNEKKLCMEYK